MIAFITLCSFSSFSQDNKGVLLDDKSYENSVYQNKINHKPKYEGLFSDFNILIEGSQENIISENIISEIKKNVKVIDCTYNNSSKTFSVYTQKTQQNEIIPSLREIFTQNNLTITSIIETLYKK